MNYIIIETQTTNGVTAVVTPVVKDNFYDAEQEFHSKLSFAAVSSVPIHAVTMITERGNVVKHECYVHTVEEDNAE